MPMPTAEYLTAEKGTDRATAVDMLTVLTGSPGTAESLVSGAESMWWTVVTYVDCEYRVDYLHTGKFTITAHRSLHSHPQDDGHL